jgi:hypothetical protein
MQQVPGALDCFVASFLVHDGLVLRAGVPANMARSNPDLAFRKTIMDFSSMPAVPYCREYRLPRIPGIEVRHDGEHRRPG